jgi:hypothetical protein
MRYLASWPLLQNQTEQCFAVRKKAKELTCALHTGHVMRSLVEMSWEWDKMSNAGSIFAIGSSRGRMRASMKEPPTPLKTEDAGDAAVGESARSKKEENMIQFLLCL